MSTLRLVPPPAEAPAPLDAVRAVRRRVRGAALLAGAGLVGLVLALGAARLLWGEIPLTPGEVWGALLDDRTAVPGAAFLVRESAVPRLLGGALVGAALGAAGAASQAMLRNPLASPDALGIGMGASAAAAVATTAAGWSGPALALAAFGGALAVAAVVHALAGPGEDATARMILVGIALSAVLASVVHAALTVADVHRAHDAMVWLVGSLSGLTTAHVPALAAFVVPGVLALCALAHRLSVVSLGDDVARALGVGVPATRRLLTLVVVLLVAASTAAVGPLAFVALLSGPLARRLTDGRDAVGLAAGVGAALVLAADHLATVAIPGTSLPAGVVTGLAGAPVLLALARSRHRTDKDLR